MKPLNDKMIANLINNAQVGKDAFEQILRYYQHDIFRIIRVYTQNDSDAEDLTQETWLKVYRSIGKLKPPYHFESWLKKVAVNTAKDWLKSRARKESQATDTIVSQQLRGRAMLEYQRQGLIERLRDAIDSLSAKRRQVVLDFYICGYLVAEISQRLDIPQSTVTGRLQEARKQLRKEFEVMVAQSAIQEKFAPDTLVRNVMDRVGNLPAPVPTGNIIQRIGRMLPKKNLPIIGTATLIALTVISIIVINLSNYKSSSNGNQKGNLIFGAGLWRKRADMPTPRVGLSTAVVNNKIYAVGGTFQWPTVLQTVEMYDPESDTWTARASMPTARYAVSTAVANDKIYAIGGLTTLNGELRALSTVEEYDPATDMWIAKANMPTPRGQVALAVVNEKIYAIGGGSIDGILSAVVCSTVEMYDTQTDTWTPRAEMPTPRTFLSASVVNGKIYAIGGAWLEKVGDVGKAFSTVEVYNPVQDTWLKSADMPTQRWGLSTAVVKGKIYAVGGTTIIGAFPNSRRWNWKTVKKVEVYDPETGIWTTEMDMPTSRSWLSTSVVKGKIYAIGGSQGEPDFVPLSRVEEFDR